MQHVIFSKNVVAIPKRIISGMVSSEVIPFETFATPYGLFIPVSPSGYQMIRWIRRGMKDILPKSAVGSRFFHVSNDGELFVGEAFTEFNDITMVPFNSEKFTCFGDDREISEALTIMLRDCKTIAQAIGIIEKKSLTGMYESHIFLVEDWVAHAKEKEYTKLFYRGRFN